MPTKKSATAAKTANGKTKAGKTAQKNAESGFVAPVELRDSLQLVLVNLLDLQLVGKQLHWNVVGPNFRDLHQNLDEIVAIARRGSDEIAERMRALHATPDGLAATIAKDTRLAQPVTGEILTTTAVDDTVKAMQAVVDVMREVHDAVDEADPTSADILHEYIAAFEQQIWFISAETRTP
ncbi:starvation-inducible DNA-binding protein [Neomicrococcus aestuarii]|uniref:Starvation-inducible DNA-binding protein n=1 Tax=Neomicrococcus aestuarii TaxID=556325 RepID=A0A7W8TW46_9MICC|nr:DNA starvation/stationary phase protection protein [Neomicrococcus aestuarii]MBB5512596.1 starvation-inducible DNA-binding protein [Neomicrococcus aestuarii]